MQPVRALHALCVLLFIATWVLPQTVRADWMNLTGAETAPNIAEVTFGDDGVKVNLEIYVGDLEQFADLIPDDWVREDLARPPLAERMERFARRGLGVEREDGTRLPAELRLVEPRLRIDRQSLFAGMVNPMTRQRVPEAPADKRVLYAELFYPYGGQRPDVLTLVPPLDDEGRPTVTIGFIAYHKAVPIIDFRYLGLESRLALDWDDPWYTKFDNPNLKRHHKSALMSFLYVEPFEVRHEALLRVRDMEQWIDLGLRDPDWIEVDELEPLQQRIGKFLLTRNPLRIDGRLAEPILDRTNFVKVTLRGIRILEVPERLETSTAIVGVILTYLTEGLPQEVTVEWELFTDQVQQVPATATDPAGPLSSYLEPDNNLHTWTNFLKNYTPPTVDQVRIAETLEPFDLPLGSALAIGLLLPLPWFYFRRRRSGQSAGPVAGFAVACLVGALALMPFARVAVPMPGVAAPALDAGQAEHLLGMLLKNVYRAFDFRGESAVYDKLALTVADELLADVYLQSRRPMIVQNAGGAQAKVSSVEVLEAVPIRVSRAPLIYEVEAKWTAEGRVGHWGHVHTRKNLYHANLRLEGRDGAWKVTGLELLEEKRIDAAAQAAANGVSVPDRR
jgi:hypothetical protein